MTVHWEEQCRREREHLCIWCAAPARWLERHGRHGVHCEKHAKQIAKNNRAWVKRRREERGKKR